LHPKAKKAKLLTGDIVANASTSKRSAVTIQILYRFHTLVDDADAWISAENTAGILIHFET
jgi:hypothetical protein